MLLRSLARKNDPRRCRRAHVQDSKKESTVISAGINKLLRDPQPRSRSSSSSSSSSSNSARGGHGAIHTLQGGSLAPKSCIKKKKRNWSVWCGYIASSRPLLVLLNFNKLLNYKLCLCSRYTAQFNYMTLPLSLILEGRRTLLVIKLLLDLIPYRLVRILSDWSRLAVHVWCVAQP